MTQTQVGDWFWV